MPIDWYHSYPPSRAIRQYLWGVFLTPLRNLQTRAAFIAPFTSEEWLMTIKKGSFRIWQLKPNFFIAHLQILAWCKTKGAVRAVCALLRIWLLSTWRPCVKGLSIDGGRVDFSKNPPRPFLSWRSMEWAYFRPYPSRWTVPLKSLYLVITSNLTHLQGSNKEVKIMSRI